MTIWTCPSHPNGPRFRDDTGDTRCHCEGVIYDELMEMITALKESGAGPLTPEWVYYNGKWYMLREISNGF